LFVQLYLVFFREDLMRFQAAARPAAVTRCMCLKRAIALRTEQRHGESEVFIGDMIAG
jgi:hypothetical protein